VTQLGSPATQSGRDDSGGRRGARGSRLARRRRVLLGVGIAAALLAIGGLIGASFVKSPQQLAAGTAPPSATVTTAAVVSQVLTSSVQMRGVVYPSTQYDVYASAPSSDSSSPGAAGASSASDSSPAGAVYISKLEVATGDTIRNGQQLAELDGQPLFALTGAVPAPTPRCAPPAPAPWPHCGTRKRGTTMRIRTGLCLLACCCAALTACTAAPPKGPDATVTTPAVGRPPAPASAQAALSSEAFTPYAALGASPGDGLAPGDTYAALETACMDDAGYGQYAASAPFFARANRGLAFPQPYGPWGYIGTSVAAQDGFEVPVADPAEGGGSPGATTSMPAGAQAAAGKCANIIIEFNDAQFVTSLAGIETMNDDISNDVVQDPGFTRATQAWTACMARNGYSSANPNTLVDQELVSLGLRAATPGSGSGPAPGASPTATQNRAQIAAAVTDADCTLSTDLAGIYFAIQASYEQQFVTSNQQALNVAVRQFKAAYAKVLSRLPALLRTTSATPNLPAEPGKPGARDRPDKPGSPTRS
jgi:hypothetical protein